MKFLCIVLLIVVSACSAHDRAVVADVEPPLESKISHEIVKIKNVVSSDNHTAPGLTPSSDSPSTFTPSFRFVPVAHCQD